MTINTIKQISLNNKYTNWYIQIILNAQKRASNRNSAKHLLGYIEGHHIIPKSFNIDIKNNIVYLTAKEHFVCHRLLSKMFTGSFKTKMAFAIFSFSRTSNNQSRIVINSRTYQVIKTEMADARKSLPFKKRKPLSPEQYARVVSMHQNRSPETNKKISEAKLGKSMSQQFKDNLSLRMKGEGNPFYGKTHTIETKQKMSDAKKGKRKPLSVEHRAALSIARKGKPINDEQKILLKKNAFKSGSEHPCYGGLPDSMFIGCIYCKKTVSKTGFTVWHGDKCKLSPSYTGPEMFLCIYCNTEHPRPTYYRYHNTNCKMKPDELNGDIVTSI